MDRLLGIKKDELTNCYMKNGIFPLLSMLAEEYQNTKKPFTVLVTDLDHFKSYNDTYGHLLGDEIIKYFSSSIRLDLYGLENFPFRFGGDEFVIVFPGRSPEEVVPLVNRLRDNMKSRACLIKGNQVKLTFSGGLASYPADGDKIEDILDNADKALYESKRLGRDRTTVYSRIWSESKKKNMMIISGTAGAVALMAILFFAQDIARGVSDAVTRTDLVRGLKMQLSSALKGASQTLDAVKRPIVHVNPMVADQTPYLRPDPAPAPPKPEPPLIDKHEGVFQTVVLKSGGRLKGTILDRNEDTVKIKLAVAGEAVMTIKNVNIERIDNV